MKFGVLALDYDGTTAREGVLNPDVRAAIAEVRSRGIVVVIVTGRILADLETKLGDLGCADAVVAENGATWTVPRSGHSRVLGQPPPRPFLEELRRIGVAFSAGHCVVEVDATSAAAVLNTIRTLELPLVLLFNRGRAMVLPQTISKATGLRDLLSALRLSPHNAIAIGDAENDHELLAACEIGVAVEWGSERLKAAADEMLRGTGPEAVASYIRRVAEHPRLMLGPAARRRLLLGHADDGSEVALSVRGRNILIAGEPRTGKSWLAGLLCEQLILSRYSLLIIDPEGDYLPLEMLPGVAVFGVPSAAAPGRGSPDVSEGIRLLGGPVLPVLVLPVTLR